MVEDGNEVVLLHVGRRAARLVLTIRVDDNPVLADSSWHRPFPATQLQLSGRQQVPDEGLAAAHRRRHDGEDDEDFRQGRVVERVCIGMDRV